MCALDPNWIGQVVELTPADRTLERGIPRADVAAAEPAKRSKEAQEILLSVPGGRARAVPLQLFFDTGAEDIGARLAQAVETVYVLSGRSGVREFEKALYGTEQQTFGGLYIPAAVQGERLYRGPDETPKRHKLITLFPDLARYLAARIDSAIEGAAPLVAGWAVRRLREQRDEVVRESFRYLLTAESERTPDADRRSAAIRQHLGSVPLGVEISGPDAPSLVEALAEARGPRDAMRRVKFEATQRANARLQLVAPLAPPGTSGAGGLGVALLFMTDSPEEQRADIDARVGIAAELDIIAAAHPIVHRLWTTDAVDLVWREQLRNRRATNEEIARRLSTDRTFRDLVGTALRKSHDACIAMEAELVEDPDLVWRYPRVVERALLGQGVPRGCLAWAAAEERIEQAHVSAVHHVNEVVSACQLLALAGGASAPAAVVLEVISLVVSTIELGEGVWRTWQQERAALTNLNPGKAFAIEPSYAAVILAVLNVAFGAFGLRSSLR